MDSSNIRLEILLAEKKENRQASSVVVEMVPLRLVQSQRGSKTRRDGQLWV